LGSYPFAQGVLILSVAFELDARLQADTLFVTHMSLCDLLIMNDARYPWVILVPRIGSVSEVFDLSAADQETLWAEATATAKALKSWAGVFKVNIGALGNVVSQLHVHIVGRQIDDPAWPGPVWGHSAPLPYKDGGEANFVQHIRASLAI
jgi:diadenosine tetraphosphate (Ap4A) HIT family hydrolase